MLTLYGHPFAAFVWKPLIAIAERGLDIAFAMVEPDHPENLDFVRRHAPTGQFPVLADGDRVVVESAAIVEYLDRFGDAPPLLPEDPDEAIEARQMESLFDDYVATPMQRVVTDALRGEASRDPAGVTEAKAALDTAYRWFDTRLAERQWAVGDRFTFADCAAAPALFYADWTHPIGEERATLRVLSPAPARPSLDCESRRRSAPLAPLLSPRRPRSGLRTNEVSMRIISETARDGAMLSIPIVRAFAAMSYVAIPVECAMADLPEKAPPAFPRLRECCAKDGVEIGDGFFRYLRFSDDGRTLVHVGNFVERPVHMGGDGAEGIVTGELPAGEYATANHQGAYDLLYDASAMLDGWVRSRGRSKDEAASPGRIEPACQVEIYRTGPWNSDDPAAWRTELRVRLTADT